MSLRLPACLLIGAALVAGIAPTDATEQAVAPRAPDNRAARVRLANQQRARELTRDLVEGVLDAQMRQLQENGLPHLPIYRDIAEMRGHLDGLIESEMRDVIDLLSRQIVAEGPEREQLLAAARRLTRQIVSRLSVQRQNLSRRLKSAEMSAQIRRLIERQSSVHDATRSLLDLAASQRDAAIATALDDQRDVAALFERLVATLDEVSGWQGQVAVSAAESLEVLNLSKTQEAVRSAATSLEAADGEQAATDQARVLLALRLILDRIEEVQGLLTAGREAALDELSRLAATQKDLTEQSRSADLAGGDGDELVNAQSELAKNLERLQSELRIPSGTVETLDLARRAADDASRLLFEQQREAALAAQDAVSQAIADIASRLREAADLDRRDKSAEQYAALAKSLEDARARMQALLAGGLPKDSVAAGALASRLRELSAQLPLPASVDAHAARAATTLEEAAAASESNVLELLARAGQATERAAAELVAAQADAARLSLVMQIGEWNRAEESLERAAALQERFSEAADEPSAFERYADQERLLATFAEQVAAALDSSLPEAAALAKIARDRLLTAGAEFRAAAQAADDDGERADAAMQSATSAAEEFRRAAEQVRTAMAGAAERLQRLSQEQREQLGPAEAALDAAIENRTQPMTPLERAALAEALVADVKSADPGAVGALHAAANAARQAGETPEEGRESVEHAWQRAAASLAARAERLERDRRLADAMALQVRQQDTAAQQLAAGSPQDAGPENDLAEAWRSIGQAAEQITGQSGLANERLAGALRTVSESHPAGLPPETDGWRLTAEMGTGLAPGSPHVSARLLARGDLASLLAGSRANERAQNTTSGREDSPTGKTDPTSRRLDVKPAESANSSGASPEESSKTAKNRPKSDAVQGARSAIDAEQEPWFARLPAEVRRAIRAEARRPPPRGYEDRLRRYFNGNGHSTNRP